MCNVWITSLDPDFLCIVKDKSTGSYGGLVFDSRHSIFWHTYLYYLLAFDLGNFTMPVSSNCPQGYIIFSWNEIVWRWGPWFISKELIWLMYGSFSLASKKSINLIIKTLTEYLCQNIISFFRHKKLYLATAPFLNIIFS